MTHQRLWGPSGTAPPSHPMAPRQSAAPAPTALTHSWWWCRMRSYSRTCSSCSNTQAQHWQVGQCWAAPQELDPVILGAHLYLHCCTKHHLRANLATAVPAGGNLTEVKLSQDHQLVAYGLACGPEQQACVVRNMQTGRTTPEGQSGMASWEALTSPLHPLVAVWGGGMLWGWRRLRGASLLTAGLCRP
jgi:hypothetical protein